MTTNTAYISKIEQEEPIFYPSSHRQVFIDYRLQWIHKIYWHCLCITKREFRSSRWDVRKPKGESRGNSRKTINFSLITPGQRHIMDSDSFMTIYGHISTPGPARIGISTGHPSKVHPPAFSTTRFLKMRRRAWKSEGSSPFGRYSSPFTQPGGFKASSSLW